MWQQQYGCISKALWVSRKKKQTQKATHCDSIYRMFWGSKIADTTNRSVFGAWGEGRRCMREFGGGENILYYDCVDS